MSARPSLQTSADSFEGLKDVAHGVHFDNPRKQPTFRDATKSPRNNVRGTPAEFHADNVSLLRPNIGRQSFPGSCSFPVE